MFKFASITGGITESQMIISGGTISHYSTKTIIYSKNQNIPHDSKKKLKNLFYQQRTVMSWAGRNGGMLPFVTISLPLEF